MFGLLTGSWALGWSMLVFGVAAATTVLFGVRMAGLVVDWTCNDTVTRG